MSHEIRTPLNIVVNYSLLLSDELKESDKDSIKNAIIAINNASDRIVRTVDLVLNMSEIQLGIYETEPREFDLYKDVIHKLTVIYGKKAEDKGLEFRVENKTTETMIIADEYSIEEIFTNLLDNAVKFTESGYIELNISASKYNKIQVEVTDTGIGIDRSYIKNLYEPFTQELHGYSRKYEGNGLGLSVVKKFCDLNNAVIQVESEKGVGTTFRVMLNRNSQSSF
jgi:signal transduction histidine kinase